MKWSRFWQRQRRDADLRRELDAYIEQETADRMVEGLNSDEARWAAMRKLGNVTRIREQVYERNSLVTLETIWRDLVYALRLIRRNPGFSLIAILSVALGIGANASVFTLLDQVMLRSLPVDRPNQLVLLTAEGFQYGSAWGEGNELSYPMYADLLEANQVFEGMACRVFDELDANIGGGGQRVRAEVVSGTYFPLLGIMPALGRVLDAGDDVSPGGHPIVVLSHRFWRERFQNDPSVVGTLDPHQQRSPDRRRCCARRVRWHRPGLRDRCVRANRDDRADDADPQWSARSTDALGQRLRAVEGGRERQRSGSGVAAVLPVAPAIRSGAGFVCASIGSRQSAVPRRPGSRDASRLRQIEAPNATHRPAVDVDGDRRARADHRLRECRQPVARARNGAAARDGGAARTRCGAAAAGASTAGREPSARTLRRRRRTRVGDLGFPGPSRVLCTTERDTHRQRSPRYADPRRERTYLRGRRRAVWPGAGVAEHESGRWRDAEGRVGSRSRRRLRTFAKSPRRHAGRVVASAAGWFGSVSDKPAEPAVSRCWIRHRSVDVLFGKSWHEWLLAGTDESVRQDTARACACDSRCQRCGICVQPSSGRRIME